jgi:type I restriction enzyme S subunit
MSEIKDIPEHWEVKKLGEVVDKLSLNKIKIKQRDYLQQGKFPVVDQGQALIGGYFNDENFVVPGEPPYIIFGDHTKVKKLINFKFIAGADGVKVLKPKSNIDPRFLYYAIHTIKIDDKGYARHFQLLEKSDIPLPPLPEQQAIVAKIEELLSELDNGKQQLQTALQQLKVYRQSLLKWAFKGKEQTIVGELFDFVGGGTPSKKVPEYWQGNIPWSSVKDVKGDYLNNTQDKISADGLKNSASNIAKPKDVILITRISPGKTIITNIETAINQDLKIVKPKFETTPKYIYYILKSIEWECVKKSSGTTVLGINLTNLKEIVIPKLDLKEQQLIVDELESKLTLCDNVEETIKLTLQQAETLRQSILKQAFEGKLV